MADKFLDFNGLSRYTSKIVDRFKSFVPVSRQINGHNLSQDIRLTADDIGVKVDTSNLVPNTRKVNGHALSSDITLTASDVGAQVSGSYATTSQLSSYVPTSRTINGKPLTDNIKLTASDIGVSQVDTNRFVDKNESNILIGNNASVTTNCVAIGRNANASNVNAISICLNTYSISDGVCIGGDASDLSSGGITIGYNSSTSTPVCAIAIGYHSGSDGSSSIAIGTRAYSAGNDSIAIGGYAAVKTLSSSNSIAIGNWSKINGSHSISIGHSASVNGSCSIAIGNYSKTETEGSIAIGNNAQVTTDYTIRLGDDSISKLQCKVTVSTTSDKRDKTDITPIDDGAVEFLKRIQAIRYKFNGRQLYIQHEEYDAEGDIIPGTEMLEKDKSDLRTYGLCSYDKEAHARGDKKGERIRVGVLAQEVQEALKEVYGDPSYGNLVDDNFYDLETKPTDVENQLTITYSNFIPFLIKAIQEQQEQIESLQNRICQLESS